MRDRDEPVTSSVPRRDDSGRILLAYVDESYSSDHFSLGALVVGGEAARRVEEGLDEIVDEYAGRFGVETDTELHGRPMFQGVGGWSRVPTRVRISAYERSLAVVAGSGARILLRGMDVGRSTVV